MPQCDCSTVCTCRHPEPPEPPPAPMGFFGWVATVALLGIATMAIVDENMPLKS